MGTVMVILLVWAVAAVVVGLAIAKVIRLRDQDGPGVDE